MDSGKDVICRVTLIATGVVQGVGFRPFVANLAREYGLAGHVRNEGGQVRIVAYGDRASLTCFANAVRAGAPAAGRVWGLEQRLESLPEGEMPPEVFTIEPSGDAAGILLPTPDIALCADCQREMDTPGDPRFQNPFISCAHCGPRFTIIDRLPYDRQNTAMAAFPLCDLCEAQYREPADRRYHAQTVCCNRCGPQLAWQERAEVGAATGDSALAAAARAIRRGGVIAVKGIGGFHLVCDALREDAVSALRILKSRESKPFAVMFGSMEGLREHCEASADEAALLTGPERPIVLLRRGKTSDVAPGVYGSSPYLGAFLPYTPLQRLLLRQAAPLVMTSANPSGLPILKDDADALAFMGANPLLEGVLYHDRAILRRADDSVLAAVRGEPLFFRRARGYVPLPVPLDAEIGPAVLALGAQMKNTVCLRRGRHLYPSAEIGDLDSMETVALYRETIEDMQALLAIRPEVAACDLHPGYESTRFALATGLPVVQVQHHFAHVASVLAETSRDGPVIGVAFDGTGYGSDGTVWGSEFLIASASGFERAAHLKPLRFVGSDESVRQCWKSAACLLYAAGLLDTSADERYPALKAALDGGFNTIVSSSMGRVFDGVSSLLGLCHRSDYDGQGAVELENAAAKAAENPAIGAFPFAVEEACGKLTVDLSPCIRTLVACRDAGEDAGLLALRFHMTVCDMAAAVCGMLRRRFGLSTVALSGGVFQNRILLSRLLPMLEQAGFETLVNHLVPPGDGGISLGQAYVAHCLARQGKEPFACASPSAAD